MNLLILLIVLLFVFGGAGFHTWGSPYGYGFSGLGGLIVLLIILRLLGII